MKTHNFTSQVLILCPDFNQIGGVASYFKTLSHIKEFNVSYFFRGKRNSDKKNPIRIFIRIINDYIMFSKVLRKREYKIVHINTSLGLLSFIRDAIFLLISFHYNVKTIVFFHGWNTKFQKTVVSYYFWLLKRTYLKADLIIMLSNNIKSALKSWNYRNEIYKIVTAIDDNILSDAYYHHYLTSNDKISILFLSRVEKSKGIYQLLHAYNQLKKSFPVKLQIAGNGTELDRIKQEINTLKIPEVELLGYVSGQKKIEVYKNADVFVLPSYTEGLPSAMAEAMAFGLPIVVTPVGGIIDFFKDEENGFLCKTKDVDSLVEKLKILLSDDRLRSNISLNNKRFAINNFSTQNIIKKLNTCYSNLLSK